MRPTEYEKAIVERFRTYWPPPQYVVKHNIGLPGKKTNARRQIDISVFEPGQSVPILIAEAKRHAGRRNAAPFLEIELPFEEWMAVLISGLSIFPDRCAGILKTLARDHFDDGVRYTR
jgi:hypothetical protein